MHNTVSFSSSWVQENAIKTWIIYMKYINHRKLYQQKIT